MLTFRSPCHHSGCHWHLLIQVYLWKIGGYSEYFIIHIRRKGFVLFMYIKCINQLLLQNNLSNWKMCLGIVIFCIPVVIVLIVIVGAGVFSKYQISFSNYHCPDFVSWFSTKSSYNIYNYYYYTGRNLRHSIDRRSLHWDDSIQVGCYHFNIYLFSLHINYHAGHI